MNDFFRLPLLCGDTRTRCKAREQRGRGERARGVHLGEGVQASLPANPVQATVLQRAQQPAAAHTAPQLPWRLSSETAPFLRHPGRSVLANAAELAGETGIAVSAAAPCSRRARCHAAVGDTRREHLALARRTDSNTILGTPCNRRPNRNRPLTRGTRWFGVWAIRRPALVW